MDTEANTKWKELPARKRRTVHVSEAWGASDCDRRLYFRGNLDIGAANFFDTVLPRFVDILFVLLTRARKNWPHQCPDSRESKASGRSLRRPTPQKHERSDACAPAAPSVWYWPLYPCLSAATTVFSSFYNYFFLLLFFVFLDGNSIFSYRFFNIKIELKSD